MPLLSAVLETILIDLLRFMPITALVAPPTLTVVQSLQQSPSTQRLSVPAINFTTLFDFPHPMGGVNYLGTASFELQRIVTQVALSGQPLPLKAPNSFQNASYPLEMYAPYLQCLQANQTLYDEARAASVAYSPQTYHTGSRYDLWYAAWTPFNRSTSPYQPKDLTQYALELWEGAADPNVLITDLETIDEESTVAAQVFVATWNNTNVDEPNMPLSVYECSLYNASYKLQLDFVNGTGSYEIKQRSMVNPVSINDIDTTVFGDPARAYMSIMGAINEALVGAVQTYGRNFGITQTIIMKTSLAFTKDFPPNLQVLPFRLGADTDKLLGTAVEEFMMNVTMSLLSVSDYL
jgi:hypothetical protein